jgi:23S rRNA (adenine2503-C2)-methyltransferase
VPDGGDPRPALTDLPVEGYAALAAVPGARSFTPASVRRWVLQRGAPDFDAMTDLSLALREALASTHRVRRGRLERHHPSRDGTLGLLTRLDDGQLIESVSIPEGERRTLCLSSQVGCAVACRFCASGLQGVVRNLSQGEILEQILTAREANPDHPLTNYVFMGSGEPTHNLQAVLGAIAVMNHPDGMGIGARRITVSTVGHPAALAKLAEVDIPFELALSVHMPTDGARQALMPGLGRSDLAATLEAARTRFERTGRRLTIEVVVLGGVNDRDEDARAFARLLAGYPALVNLIPWNRVDGVELRTPDPRRVDALAATLRRAGVQATVRRPRGQDVGVACGQLRRRAEATDTTSD